jgi:hypothetical protein
MFLVSLSADFGFGLYALSTLCHLTCDWFQVSVVSLRDVARCVRLFCWFFARREGSYAHRFHESMMLALAHIYYYRVSLCLKWTQPGCCVAVSGEKKGLWWCLSAPRWVLWKFTRCWFSSERLSLPFSLKVPSCSILQHPKEECTSRFFVLGVLEPVISFKNGQHSTSIAFA